MGALLGVPSLHILLDLVMLLGREGDRLARLLFLPVDLDLELTGDVTSC